jgi:Chlamydia-phage Chp2 scaffold (Chlamy_scaf)
VPEGPILTTEGEGPGADQSFKDDCDINVIMDRAIRGAEIIDPMVTGGKAGSYMDLSTAPDDYFHARQIMIDAEDRFNALPARIRNRFENEPLLLLEFLANDSNREEAINLGLIEKPPAEPAAKPAGDEPPPK